MSATALRTLLVAVVALALGIAAGAIGEAALTDDTAQPDVHGSGTLASVPKPPLSVSAETVTLRKGFQSHHYHPGPTFNLVRKGEVKIIEEEVRRYGPGDLFFEPARRRHTIVVLKTARLDVLRLLPPGKPATIEVPAPAQ